MQKNKNRQFANRADFVERLLAARLAEIDEQCEAIRRGLLSACIPAPVLGLWTVDELRGRVRGRARPFPVVQWCSGGVVEWCCGAFPSGAV